MKNSIKYLVAIIVSCSSILAAEQLTPAQALQALKEGNMRYTQDKLTHPNHTQDRRDAISSKQNPFAVIVSCSDSRVVPEIIFDQGLGDLFVIRVAGNVIGPIELASIEFAATQLGAPLIMVMGHENCGAVNAVVQHQAQDIKPIAEKVEYAIKNFSKPNGNALETAIKANVRGAVAQLRNSPDIAKIAKDHSLGIVGGYYHLNSGAVELCCDLESTPASTSNH